MKSSRLPDFTSPPVGEVVLSSQFSPLSTLEAVHFGLFWNEIRSDYALIETHPTIAPVIETFEKKLPPRPQIQLELTAIPAVPRVWYVSEDKTLLVQLQQDRLVCNWRRVKDSDIYPRYEAVRERFVRAWEKFSAFVEREKLGQLTANQCEVTYINQIHSGTTWTDHREVGKVLRPWSGIKSAEALANLEGARLALSFEMKSSEAEGSGKTVGRLHVDFQPAFSVSTGKAVFVLNLTARGAPLGLGLEGTLRFFDL